MANLSLWPAQCEKGILVHGKQDPTALPREGVRREKWSELTVEQQRKIDAIPAVEKVRGQLKNVSLRPSISCVYCPLGVADSFAASVGTVKPLFRWNRRARL